MNQAHLADAHQDDQQAGGDRDGALGNERADGSEPEAENSEARADAENEKERVQDTVRS